MQAASVRKPATGELPNQWKLFLLDDVAVRGSGHTPDKKHPEYWNGEIKWISLRDTDRLDKLYISDTTAKITPLGIAHSSAVVHPAGTVVLSRDAGVGKSSIMTCEMAVSQHFMAWHCGPSLNNVFLYYWLQSRKSEFERIAMGNTIKTIGLPYFRALRLLLPPIEEQLAIAAALSDVDALINSLDRLIAKKRDIKQATMQQLLTGKTRLPGFKKKDGFKQTEIGQIPKDWHESPVKDFTVNHKQGYYTKDRYVQHGIRLVRITDLLNPQIDYESMPMLNISKVEYEQFRIGKGDFLFARSGAIGRYGIVAEEVEAVFGSYIIRFALDQTKVMNEYFGFLYETKIVWKQLLSITQGSSNININASNIKSIKVPLPPIDEQLAIVSVLSSMSAEIKALERRRDKTILLKQGMMQELLTGRIRLV
ncbi:MAG: restriction endonuclease subunit S [Cyanobacteria bacterium HKST-UBA02]|nr:restriction endonuclease subunit S [Cyanobacteria bacterium HKST-UBA02]